IARAALDAARSAWRLPANTLGYLRAARLARRGDGFALAPVGALHHYGAVACFTTLARQLRELGECGFAAGPEGYESTRGERLEPTATDLRLIDWFTFVATVAP